MPVTDSAGHSEPGWRKNLEMASWLIALTAVAMPLIGYLIRVGTFYFSQTSPNAYYLAAATPVSQLAATAAPSVIEGLVLAGVLLIISGPRLRRARLSATVGNHPKGRPLVDGAVALATVVVIVLFWGPFPNMLVAIGSAFLAMFYLDRLATRDLRYSVITVLPALAIVLVGAIALGIVTGDIPGTQPALYSFTSSAVAPNGAYQLLGTDSGLLYLRACTVGKPVIAVDSSSVRQVRFPATIPVTRVPVNSGLLNVLKDHARISVGLETCA